MGPDFMDIAVLAIGVISVIVGFKHGFLQTLSGVVSLVLSFVLATAFHPYATEYLSSTPLRDTIYTSVSSVISVPEEEAVRISDYGTGKLNLPREMTNNMQRNVDLAAEAVEQKITDMITNAAMNIISMLMVFFAVRLVLFILTAISGIIRKMPVIGFGNGLLGALFGLLRGMFLVYLLLAIVAFSASVSPNNGAVQSVKQSELAKVMYHNNILLEFIYKK